MAICSHSIVQNVCGTVKKQQLRNETVECVNKGSDLNPGHSEIWDLKVNCDWSLGLHLFTLHTGKPKVRPHHVLLTTLHM